jgi:mitogen-activated protein kinase 15
MFEILRPQRFQQPSNVLLNSECHVKVCDFGLARSIASIDDEKSVLNYLQYLIEIIFDLIDLDLFAISLHIDRLRRNSLVSCSGNPSRIQQVRFPYPRTGEPPLSSSCVCRYTKSVDMWAMGCILGEMLLGKPLFPGKSTLHQIETIMEFTGRPEFVQSLASYCFSIKSSIVSKFLQC